MQLTASLPEPSDERVAVHVRKEAIREIRSGHPWIWDGSIERQSKPGEPGDLAVIFDDKRDFAAIGLLDPGSPISVRVLHQGKPRTIDDAFFAELRAEFSDAEILDLLVCISSFLALGRMMQVLDVAVDCPIEL